MPELRFRPATDTDAEALATLRVSAMRPSLEAVGRFDPERARLRFLSTYVASETTILISNRRTIGFFVVRDRSDHLYLDHLYVVADAQGHGFGKKVLARLKSEGRPIRLMALNGSPANAFYRASGFRAVSADTLDTYYEWIPT
jgi:GNAT superfamily N-acetyltransferase